MDHRTFHLKECKTGHICALNILIMVESLLGCWLLCYQTEIFKFLFSSIIMLVQTLGSKFMKTMKLCNFDCGLSKWTLLAYSSHLELATVYMSKHIHTLIHIKILIKLSIADFFYRPSIPLTNQSPKQWSELLRSMQLPRVGSSNHLYKMLINLFAVGMSNLMLPRHLMGSFLFWK